MCFFNTETYEIKKKSCFFRNDGLGKSSIGQIVSSKLNINFTDIDNEIEKELGINIKDIFKLKVKNILEI